MARGVVVAAAVLWVLCLGGSLVALNLPPEGDGFLRGMNRIEGFLLWQLVGLGVAVVGLMALLFVERPRSGLLRLLGYGPVAVSVLIAVVLAGLIFWAANAPPPAAPAGTSPAAPVTAPTG